MKGLVFASLMMLVIGATAQHYDFEHDTVDFEFLTDSVTISDGENWNNDWYYDIQLPFTFYYFDSAYTEVTVLSDGRLGFDTNGNYEYIKPYGANQVDAGYFITESQSPISMKLDTVEDQRILKFEWRNAAYYADVSDDTIDFTVSYQLWLYEGTDVFEFHYGPTTCIECDYDYWDFWGSIGYVNDETDDVHLLHLDYGSDYYWTDNESDYYDGFPAEGTVYRFIPDFTCGNGILDGEETDVDCGPGCTPCHCSNGIMDGDEKAVDCGGSCPEVCEYEICPFDNEMTASYRVSNILHDTLVVEDLRAGQYFQLTNLHPGFQYKITTCRNDEYLWFDTSLMLYDQDSTFRAGNDYDYTCAPHSSLYYTAEEDDTVYVLLDTGDDVECGHDIDDDATVYIMLVDVSGAGCGLVGPEICMVTYDAEKDYNVVVWEQVEGAVDHYNIYRESTVLGQFDLIGEVPADSTSDFMDSTSQPNVRAYKYQISMVDSCGSETNLSKVHETMLLQSSLGVGGEVNLDWSAYDGVDFTSFLIWRDTDIAGLELAATLPANLFQYNDLPPVGALNLKYHIELLGDVTCAATPKTTARNYNSVRSNTVSVADMSVGISDSFEGQLQVHPNPATTTLLIEVNGFAPEGIPVIVDGLGRQVAVATKQLDLTHFQVDVTSVPQGVYMVQLSARAGVAWTKVVVH